jgi:HK97 family phage prohead protease
MAKAKAMRAAAPKVPEPLGRSRSATYELPADAMGDQFRAFTFPIEPVAGGDGRTLLGRAVPYGVTAEVGPFKERFVLGAFAKQIASGTVGRVKVYESHQARLAGAPPIGKTSELHERSDGLHGAWPLFATSRADDALQLVRDGEVTGMSVGFRAVAGGSVQTRDGVVERRVVHLDHVILTHEPAYADAGVLAVRSLAPTSAWQSDLDAMRRTAHGEV